jgi:hypothetical protein
MVALGTIHDWSPGAGSVVTWHASPATCAIVGQASENAAPPGYQQAQHLRAFRQHRGEGLDMARLCIGSWDIPGVCDIPAMTKTFNAHLRRHDTYHSWFEFSESDDLVRRTIGDPSEIELLPMRRGQMSAAQIRADILSTPDPLQWDCFRFGVIQRGDRFTVYAGIDHLLTDAMSVGVIFLEIYATYHSLVQGTPISFPAAASHRDHCVRERERTRALTWRSPQIRAWLTVAEQNGGTLPGFPLPLGDRSTPCTGGMVTVPLMDEAQSASFESVCQEAGVRFSGGVFASAALAHHELTGAEIYFGITPYDTRSTAAERMTPGWFASFIPVAVPLETTSFGDVARAAQHSFDAAKELANVPFDRVLELAPPAMGLRNPVRGVPMLSFLDVRKVHVSAQWDALNLGIYGDSRLSDQVCTWVNRFENETTLTVSFPDNPIARDSVARYIDAIQSAYALVADHDRAAAS